MTASTMRPSARALVKSMTPPVVWNLLSAAKNGALPRRRAYQGVTTDHNMDKLHGGEFGRAFEAAAALDPNLTLDTTRLRQYNAYVFADYASHAEGDFLSAGISYGIAPKVIYEAVLKNHRPSKTYHLIDPFVAFDGSQKRRPTYNTDPEYVRRQYPAEAPIRIHQAFIPDCFPLPDLTRLAFVHLNTGVPRAEADSLKYLYERLSPGGALLVDSYAFGAGNMGTYDAAAKPLGASFSTLVTGQGIMFKPASG